MKNNTSAIKIEHLSSNEVPVVRLDDERLFSIGTGGTPSTSQPQYWNGEIPWVTPTDLSNLGTATITETARTITPQGVANSSAKPLPAGTIVISTRAPIGYATILGKEMAINQGCKAVVIKDPAQVSSEYLYYNVLTQTQKMQELGSGSTFRELSQHNLKSIEVPLPTITDQKKIALILNTIQESIEIQEKIIKKTKELKGALMQKLFTEGTRGEKLKETEIGKIPESWGVTKLDDLTEVITKGTTPTTYGYKYTESGVNFIKVESITGEGNFIPEKLAHIDNSTNQYLSRSVLRESDILFSIAGALGRVAVVDKNILPANTNQALAIIRLESKSRISPEFLKLYLMSHRIQIEIKSILVRSAQSNLSLTQVKNLQVGLPSFSEQQEIVDILKTVDSKIEIEEKKKGLYEELFQTMLSKLMTGEIRVNNINFN